jgi:hypothetical protein
MTVYVIAFVCSESGDMAELCVKATTRSWEMLYNVRNKNISLIY